MFLTLTFPWPRSELTIQAPNDFGLDLKVPWQQLLVRNRFMWVAENEVGHIGRWTRGAGTLDISPKIILATNEDRAIDLSCRACGAGAWALGLDSRWGSPLLSVFHPQPPIRTNFWNCRAEVASGRHRIACRMPPCGGRNWKPLNR